MGIFDKKFCDICGNKIGLLGNRKLKDGNMCADCAKKISPLLTGRREFTLEDMKRHLAYREANQGIVKNFKETRTIGNNYRLHIDDDQGFIVISKSSNFRNDNPDVLQFSQITGCNFIIKEEQHSVEDTSAPKVEGKPTPRKTIVDYDVQMTISINSPWFQNMEVSLGKDLKKYTQDYNNAVKEAEEIKKALAELHFEQREKAVAAAAPKKPVTCPNCGGVSTPTPEGRCEYCNSVIEG
jgi:hypothetical protein